VFWAGEMQHAYLSALLLKLSPDFSQHLLFLLQHLLSVFSCFEHLQSCCIHLLFHRTEGKMLSGRFQWNYANNAVYGSAHTIQPGENDSNARQF